MSTESNVWARGGGAALNDVSTFAQLFGIKHLEEARAPFLICMKGPREQGLPSVLSVDNPASSRWNQVFDVEEGGELCRTEVLGEPCCPQVLVEIGSLRRSQNAEANDEVSRCPAAGQRWTRSGKQRKNVGQI